MAADGSFRLALIVRTPPSADRSGRAQLDMALTAATLEMPLDVYFVGRGARQLEVKGWNSLPQLTDVRAFIDPEGAIPMQGEGESALRPTTMEPAVMADHWRQCARVMVL